MMEATAQDKKCAHLCFKETKKGGKSKGRPQTFQEKNILSKTANILQRKQFHWQFSKPIWRTLT